MVDPAKTPLADPFAKAAAMREPIFYGAEFAYSFQYRDFSVKRYERDKDWMIKNKGFSPEEARQVVAAISQFLNEKLLATLKKQKDLPPDQWTMLAGFAFTIANIAEISGLSKDTVDTIVAAFSFPEDGNPTFTSLNAFNSANAFPIFKGDDDTHILFLYVGLTDALYDTPFYWMVADKAYQATAMTHRGQFTEEFTAERLEYVFGGGRVFRNVDIWETKARKNKLSEIDALVVIADHVIVVQAKSKKLTLEARKGNDLQLQADFKGAVQDACDQAFACSQLIIAGEAVFADAKGNEIQIVAPIKRIHPICVVSDHYPALSFQARQFLKSAGNDVISSPIVCDVFFIDVVAEFLDTPLRYLSYLELRAKAGDNVMLSHEITALGFHLRQNLWLGEYDLLMLEDDISTDVDIAMAARREGIAGRKTPPGILTHLSGTTIGRIIEEIEKRSEAGAISVGLELLKLSGKSANNLSLAIDKIAADAKDGKGRDITVASKGAGGITVHCNGLLDHIAASNLKRHCELRKYSQKASFWSGLAIQPRTADLRFGLFLDYRWVQDKAMDEAVAKMSKPQPIEALSKFTKSPATTSKKSRRNKQKHSEQRDIVRQTREFREKLKREK